MKALLILTLLAFTGCAGATGAAGIASDNPIQRGCGYIAAAIVTHGALQIIFRK